MKTYEEVLRQLKANTFSIRYTSEGNEGTYVKITQHILDTIAFTFDKSAMDTTNDFADIKLK